jgi:hypothetical protein
MLIVDMTFVKPTFEYHQFRSRTECASVCFWMGNCATISICFNVGNSFCKMSAKKVTCMEKEEVMVEKGCYVFQTNVSTQR